jgi:hypothetical protein
MLWNNVPHCIPPPPPLDHGVMDCIFVMTCCDKITCHEKNCQQKGLHTICHSVHVCNYICMRYVNAHIYERLNPRPHESTPRP